MGQVLPTPDPVTMSCQDMQAVSGSVPWKEFEVSRKDIQMLSGASGKKGQDPLSQQ